MQPQGNFESNEQKLKRSDYWNGLEEKRQQKLLDYVCTIDAYLKDSALSSIKDFVEDEIKKVVALKQRKKEHKEKLEDFLTETNLSTQEATREKIRLEALVEETKIFDDKCLRLFKDIRKNHRLKPKDIDFLQELCELDNIVFDKYFEEVNELNNPSLSVPYVFHEEHKNIHKEQKNKIASDVDYSKWINLSMIIIFSFLGIRFIIAIKETVVNYTPKNIEPFTLGPLTLSIVFLVIIVLSAFIAFSFITSKDDATSESKKESKETLSDYEDVEIGWVYLIKSKDRYKIGQTKDLLRRMRELKTAESSNHLIYDVKCKNFLELEKELHDLYDECRYQGSEIFDFNSIQLDEVIKIMKERSTI